MNKPSMTRRVFALVAMVYGLTACQTDNTRAPVTLEQAKTISVAGRGGFIAPRNITDVLQQVRSAKPDKGRLELLKRDADADVASPLVPHYRFLRARSRARDQLGRDDEALADLRASYVASRGVLSPRLGKRALAVDLAIAEEEAGNYQRALNVLHEIFKESPIGVEALVKLADIYGAIGDAERSTFYAQRWQPGGRTVGVGPPDYSIPWIRAALLESKGNWSSAERDLRNSIELFRTGGKGDPFNRLQTPNWVEKQQLRLTDNLLFQGRAADAEIAARQALSDVLHSVGRQHNMAVASLLSLAKTLSAQNRSVEALDLVDAASAILDEMRVPEGTRLRRQADHLIGRIRLARGDIADSAGAFLRSRAALADDDYQMNVLFRQSPDAILALAASERSEDAVFLARGLHVARSSTYGDMSFEAAEAAGILAYALARTGATTDASERYRAYLKGTAARPHDRRRMLIEDFVDILMSASRHEEAMAVADEARGSTVNEAIEAIVYRQAAAASPETAEMIRQGQDLGFTADALRGQLARLAAMPGSEEVRGLRDSVRSEFAQVQSAMTVLQQEIARRIPELTVARSTVSSLQTAAADRLRRDEALISILVGVEKTHVWVVNPSGRIIAHTARVGRGDIARLVGSIRDSLEFPGDRIEALPEFDAAGAAKIYHLLLEPVRQGWKDAKALVVVSDGPLNFLPFALLPIEPLPQSASGGTLFDRYRRTNWLGIEHAITSIPSISAFVSLRSSRAVRANRKPFFGVGDPWFNSSQAGSSEIANLRSQNAIQRRNARVTRRGSLDDRSIGSSQLADLMPLPETADEVRDIARIVGADESADVLVGQSAREDVIKRTDLDDRRVLMFATHGLVAGDLDGLTQPALALSNPAVVGGDGDGLLTMEEVMNLKLDADWVVLSACNTAAGEGAAGADALSGLGRAFFYAGSRAVLATHWPVETESARLLTSELFRRQALDSSLSRSEALRQAMTAVIQEPIRTESRRAIGTYAHPVFWAPFALIGDGG